MAYLSVYSKWFQPFLALMFLKVLKASGKSILFTFRSLDISASNSQVFPTPSAVRERIQSQHNLH